MKKIIVCLLTAALVTEMYVTPAAAEDSWSIGWQQDSTLITFDDQKFEYPSSFMPHGKNCNDKLDCTMGQASSGEGRVDYPACDETRTKFCIRELTFAKTGEVATAATLDSKINRQKIDVTFPQGKFVGGTPTIWKSGEQLYAVHAYTFFTWQGKAVKPSNIEIAIAPVRVTSPIGRQQPCLFISDGKCFVEENFDLNVKASITVNVPDSLGGFYMGRVLNAEVTQTGSLGNKSRDITVSGSAELVPRLAYAIPGGTKLPAALKAREGMGASYGTYNGEWYLNQEVAGLIETTRKWVYDIAPGANTSWRILSQDPNQSTYARCVGAVPELLGWGTTNSMFYDFRPPQFSSGSLDFKTLGTHYVQTDGNLALGTYEVQLNSAFARCMYGLSKLPLYASISVINDASQKVVGTSVVGEQGKWLKLKADGFTFSRKTVRVKIGQSKGKVAQVVGSKAKR